MPDGGALHGVEIWKNGAKGAKQRRSQGRRKSKSRQMVLTLWRSLDGSSWPSFPPQTLTTTNQYSHTSYPSKSGTAFLSSDAPRPSLAQCVMGSAVGETGRGRRVECSSRGRLEGLGALRVVMRSRAAVRGDTECWEGHGGAGMDLYEGRRQLSECSMPRDHWRLTLTLSLPLTLIRRP